MYCVFVVCLYVYSVVLLLFSCMNNLGEGAGRSPEQRAALLFYSVIYFIVLAL